MSRINKNIDPIHIQQMAFDADKEATRVVIVSDIQLALDAQEDSVVAVKKSVKIENATSDCAGMSKICLFDKGSIWVSPDTEGETWYLLSEESLVVKNICACRVKVVGKAVMNG